MKCYSHGLILVQSTSSHLQRLLREKHPLRLQSRLAMISCARIKVPHRVHDHRQDSNLTAMQQTVLRGRYMNSDLEVGPTERPSSSGHQVNPKRSADICDPSIAQQSLITVVGIHAEADTLMTILTASETVAFLEVVERIAGDTHERTFRVHALQHKLEAAHMIARQELLDAREKGLVVIAEVVVHRDVAAGIIEAAIWIKVDVSDWVTHSESYQK